MRVHIEGDGGQFGTSIFLENGDELIDVSSRVRKVSFEHEAGKIPVVTLTLLVLPGDKIELPGEPSVFAQQALSGETVLLTPTMAERAFRLGEGKRKKQLHGS